MIDRLLKLIKDTYESDADFERALELKEKTVDSWKRSNSKAYYKMLPVLCRHFSVSADYLLELTDLPQPHLIQANTEEPLSEELQGLISDYQQLDWNGRKAVIHTLDEELARIKNNDIEKKVYGTA